MGHVGMHVEPGFVLGRAKDRDQFPGQTRQSGKVRRPPGRQPQTRRAEQVGAGFHPPDEGGQDPSQLGGLFGWQRMRRACDPPQFDVRPLGNANGLGRGRRPSPVAVDLEDRQSRLPEEFRAVPAPPDLREGFPLVLGPAAGDAPYFGCTRAVHFLGERRVGRLAERGLGLMTGPSFHGQHPQDPLGPGAPHLQRDHAADAVAAHIKPLELSRAGDQHGVRGELFDGTPRGRRPASPVAAHFRQHQRPTRIEFREHALPLAGVAEASGNQHQRRTAPRPIKVRNLPLIHGEEFARETRQIRAGVVLRKRRRETESQAHAAEKELCRERASSHGQERKIIKHETKPPTALFRTCGCESRLAAPQILYLS